MRALTSDHWDSERTAARAVPRPAHHARFEAVFLEKYSGVVGALLRLTGDQAQAEELAGEAFWRLYQKPALLQPSEDPGGWLYRTATRLGIDALRSATRRRKYEYAAAQANLAEHEQADPLAETLRTERTLRVREVLGRLRPVQAQLLVLRHGGLSYRELAAVLDVKPSSIGTLLARAEAEFEAEYRRQEERV